MWAPTYYHYDLKYNDYSNISIKILISLYLWTYRYFPVEQPPIHHRHLRYIVRKCMLRVSHRMHSSSAAVALLSAPSSLFPLCWLVPPQLPHQQQQQQHLSFKHQLFWSAPLRLLCNTGSSLPGSSSEARVYSVLGRHPQHQIVAFQQEQPWARGRGCFQQQQRQQQQQQDQRRRNSFAGGSSFVPTAAATSGSSSPTSSAVAVQITMAGIDTPAGACGGRGAGDGGADKEGKLVLNRDDFSKEISVVAIKVPAKRTRSVFWVQCWRTWYSSWRQRWRQR